MPVFALNHLATAQIIGLLKTLALVR